VSQAKDQWLCSLLNEYLGSKNADEFHGQLSNYLLVKKELHSK
jgi:hypothetical protein